MNTDLSHIGCASEISNSSKTMKLEQQVSSLELSKRLKELGVKQESYFSWHRGNSVKMFLVESTIVGDEENYPAFTVAELGEMLPKRAEIETFKSYVYGSGFSKWRAVLTFKDGEEMRMPMDMSDTEADARAKMLIYLLEQGILNPTQTEGEER